MDSWKITKEKYEKQWKEKWMEAESQKDMNEIKNAELKAYLSEIFSKLISICDDGNLDIYTKQHLANILFQIDQLYPSILDNFEKEKKRDE